MSERQATDGDGEAGDSDAVSRLQGAIEESASRKSASKACRTCLGMKRLADGTRCSVCSGSGIDPKGGKEAAGTLDLTTK